MTVSDGDMVLDAVEYRTRMFLSEYIPTDYESIKTVQNDSDKFKLNDIAVVIYIRGKLEYALMMSYQEDILKNISKTFLGGAKIEENDKEEIYDSVAKETANIIIGLSFESGTKEDEVSKITPPVKVDDAIIKKFDNLKRFSEDIITKSGTLSISVIDYAEGEV